MPLPLAVSATLLLAIVVVLVVAERIVGAPPRDVELLAIFMTTSGVLSLVLGALVIRWAAGRFEAELELGVSEDDPRACSAACS